MFRAAPTAVFALLALGCTESPRRDVALREALAEARAAARPKPLTAADLRDAEAIRRVLARDVATGAPALGGVEYTVTHRARLRDDADNAPPGAVAEIDETIRLQITAQGDFALDHQIKWAVQGDDAGESGRRCWRVKGAYYTAGRHGAATQVPVEVDEDARCLASGLGPLHTLLDRVIDELDLSASGAGVVLDRPVQTLVGLHAARPERTPAEVPEAYGRRHRDRAFESYAVFNGPRNPLIDDFTDLRGAKAKARFDTETGLPLAAEVQGVFAVRKLGKTGTLTVDVTVESARFAAAIAAPEVRRVWGPRDRPFEDQAALLGPLADPPDAALPQPGEAPKLGLTVDEAELEKRADAPLEDAAPPPPVVDAAVPAPVIDAATPDAGVVPPPRDEDAPEARPLPVRDEDAP